MTDSHHRESFRRGWCPSGFSRDVTLGFQRLFDICEIRPDQLYYFKPLSTFIVPELSTDELFESIDEYLEREFVCDGRDIWTVCTPSGPVVLVPQHVLQRAGVKLPSWPSRPRQRRASKFVPVVVQA